MPSFRILFLSILIVALASVDLHSQRKYEVLSPDGLTKVKVEIGDKILYSVYRRDMQVISPSEIGIVLYDGNVLGHRPKVKRSKRSSHSSKLPHAFGKRETIDDTYNNLQLDFGGDYSLTVRMYNEGVAYRFSTTLRNDLKIRNETVTFNFPSDHKVWYIPKVALNNDGEGTYSRHNISQMPDSVYGLTPLVVETSPRLKIAITESALLDYAGLNLKRNPRQNNSLIGHFATEVEQEVGEGWIYKIRKRKDYIAITKGTRDFPWRIIQLAEKDIDLTNSDLVYKLAKPPAPDIEVSWIKPGKAAWDWWVDWSIQGVDFKGEMQSHEYYKHLIDFAAAQGLEYVEISVGWMNDQDILSVSPRIKMPELVEYARAKDVGIMVWVVAHTLERQFDQAFDLFSKLKVAGVKVDFFDADHQSRIRYYEKIAQECMKRKLMVYYHGACKPTGLERTYPCIINYEGVQANEYNKWSNKETPGHSVNVAYIRNMAGGMDMNLGPMRNAQGDAFAISNSYPMSQGTRCHQLSMYVVYLAAFNMVADAPDVYEKDKHCIKLISSIPEVWTESKPLDGTLGEYLIVARKKDDRWFVGGINNETERNGEINFEFLEKGQKYKATIFADGINANKVGTDYKVSTLEVTSASKFNYKMASGGGFVIQLEPVKS